MNPPTPLKGKRFEQKPKRVIKADDFADNCGVMHDARLRWQLNDIIDSITNGFRVREEYYARGIDARGDRLLRELGVKHLHLGGPGSDIIVYMAEFDTWVELLEINTHVHLETEPRGKDLKGRFRGAVEAAATFVATAAAKAKSKKAKRSGRRTRT